MSMLCVPAFPYRKINNALFGTIRLNSSPGKNKMKVNFKMGSRGSVQVAPGFSHNL